jgi:hypothetical protein
MICAGLRRTDRPNSWKAAMTDDTPAALDAPMPDSLRSSLARHQLVRPAGRDQHDRMNRAAWRRQGRFMVCPDEIEARDPWLAQALRNLATRLYGQRTAD